MFDVPKSTPMPVGEPLDRDLLKSADQHARRAVDLLSAPPDGDQPTTVELLVQWAEYHETQLAEIKTVLVEIRDHLLRRSETLELD